MPSPSDVSSLTDFIERQEESNWSAQIVNRTEPAPVEQMVGDLFGEMSIDVTETDRSEVEDDLFLLLRDGDVVENSSLRTLKETLLLVNSDLYQTGTRSLEHIEPPDVIMELSDTVFTLRGYPESNTEKLVLTLVSRYIEHQAWLHGAGTLRTSFQRLSRLDDEQGTRQVYERLGGLADLDVHVYGVPDWEPPASMGVTVHGIAADEIMHHWFVVHRVDDETSIAMAAVRVGANEWKGFWTFDTDTIRAMDAYIQQTF